MSDTLVVPITLEILLANEALRGRDFFRTWRHSYAALRDFCSPEPMAFDCDTEDGRTGAFLHWTLPRSLRASAEGNITAFPLVPNRWLINRVCQPSSAANPPKSWVVESDYLHNDAAEASYFMVDGQRLTDRAELKPEGIAAPGSGQAGNAYPVNIGKAFALAAWQEHSPLPDMFLQAIAPGNLEFSGYVPFNEGVFSFFDRLESVGDGTSVSYQVIGWYSDATRDIVVDVARLGAGTANTPAARSAAVLAALNWGFPKLDDGSLPPVPAGLDIKTSLYSGMATGLLWETKPNAFPRPDELETTRNGQNLNVALANNSVDAFTTLVGTQLEVKGYEHAGHVVELLRAFHYDLLPLLNQPNGSELLSERIRQEWFSSRAGGTQWAIVAAPPNAGPAPSVPAPDEAAPPEVALTPVEAQWLQELNNAQQDVDQHLAELTRLQWELHAAWWKQGYYAAANRPAVNDAFAQELKDQQQNLQKGVLKHLNDLDGLLAKVPNTTQAQDNATQAQDANENKQAQYLKAIEYFISQPQNKLKDGKTLKAVTQPRYWLPRNPSVVISQVQPSEITDPDNRLTVTLAQPPGSSPPRSGDFLKLPAAVQVGVNGLYEQFCRLSAAQANPRAATASAAPAAQANPGAAEAAWQQQWHPMYLEWEVVYTDVPYVDPVTKRPNWRFNGTDYELYTELRGIAMPQLLSGRSLLSPNAQLTFGARLQTFVKHFQSDDHDLQKLCNDIESVDDWKFLSQELVGLNDWLTQRDTRIFRTPTGEQCKNPADQPVRDRDGQPLLLEKVLGFPTTSTSPTPGYDTPAAAQGLINSVPAIAPTPSGRSAFPFHAVRSGQLYLNHLVLYDKFGRKLDLVMPEAAGMLDANVFPLIRDAALLPLPPLNLHPSVEATVQLPPRLLQPARLDLLLVDQKDGSQLGQGLDTNPVGGWLLANHLDQALLIFAPDGTSLGEIVANHTGPEKPRWVAPPHAAAWLKKVADITAKYPRLGSFVAALEDKTALEFQTLLRVIDQTLWTVDPLGNRADQHLSVLVGRPLALVAMQVQFSLYGPPLTGCDWHADQDLASPLTNGAEFSVRFGNQASREDGVIGYFKTIPATDSSGSIDYKNFYSVVAPDEEKQQYVHPIGPWGNSTGNYLSLPLGNEAKTDITLLVDPRATIHATTGILPVKTLQLPQRFVHQALASMEISFKVGPLLSKIKPVPASQVAPAQPAVPTASGAATATATNSTAGSGPAAALAEALSYLPISEKNGAWSWWEKTLLAQSADPAWKEYALIDATTTANPSGGPATLREGYLQFKTSLDDDTQEPDRNPANK